MPEHEKKDDPPHHLTEEEKAEKHEVFEALKREHKGRNKYALSTWIAQHHHRKD